MQMQQPQIATTVVVPAYNEEEGLPVTLEKLLGQLDDSYEVIVVDDGSTDRTAEIAGRFPCRVIKHEVNRGKGEAIKTGIREARGRNIISIDADDTYEVGVVPAMVDGLSTYDVVIGSRFYGRENVPRLNRLGNFLIRTSMKLVFRFKPHDPLTGLWGIRKECAEKILPTVRYAPDAEMWMKASRMKLSMLDIHTTYAPRIGETKLPAIKGGWEHFKLIWKLRRWQYEASENARL